MGNNSHRITFEYKFTKEKGFFSFKDRNDVSKLLDIGADFILRINDGIYFQLEDLPILELYRALFEWKKKVKKKKSLESFQYYTMEHPHEEGAILSLILFDYKARIHSIWGNANVDNNEFDQTYLVGEFMNLEQQLKNDLESHFGINVDRYVKYFPYLNVDINFK